jgi:type IV pilus assembly protein PilM
MDSHQVAWGLDIGHSSIKAVKLSRSGDGVTVLGYAIEPVTVPEGGDRDAVVITALQSIVAREEFGATPVFAAISGRQVFSRSVNVPVINQKRMHAMVELEAKQQIPGNFDEVEWGYHSSPAADGASLDVALFAVKHEVIEQLIAKSKTIGINLAGVSVPSLALYNFINFDQEFPDGEAVIVLDVGAENTDLVVYQADQLWMRSLPVSGNDITQTFAKKFRVSVAEAETLKRQVNDSRQADKIIKVIENGLSELVSEINRSLGFYRTQNASATLDNLVISGNTFRLPGLPEYMAEKLRLTINILEDLDRIQVAGGIDRGHFMRDLQSLGVAMGLGLQATGMARTNVNLMPKSMQAERILASKRWAALAALGLLGATMWVDYGVASAAADTNSRLAAKVTQYAKDNRVRMSQSKAVLETVQQLAPQLAAFDVLGANQGLTHAVLSSVTDAVLGIAQNGAFRPQTPTMPAAIETTPVLQGAYLRKIEFPEAAGGPEGRDPFRPLATPRTVMIQIDIPAGASQGEVRSVLLKTLRELPMPAHLQDLSKAPTLFTDVQATSDIEGTVNWYYLDRDRLDEKGDLRPVEERKSMPTSTTTYSCTIAAAAGAVGGEAKP